MSDSWIDKKELNDLISGFAPVFRGNQPQTPEDIFDDIPSLQMPRTYAQAPANFYQQPGYAPPPEPFPPSNSPLQVLVNRPQTAPPFQAVADPQRKIASPFAFDEEDDDELGEIESHIEHLATETAKALRVLQEIRNRVDAGGLISPAGGHPTKNQEPRTKNQEPTVPEFQVELCDPQDRIPLDVQIDAHLPLKGRLRALSDILKIYVGMEEMIVVDRDGFSLFSTDSTEFVGKNVANLLKSIRKVYASEAEARTYTASQVALENGKWLFILPSDGETSGKFLMKVLLPEPLDRPEMYVLVELLNEVLRPETN